MLFYFALILTILILLYFLFSIYQQKQQLEEKLSNLKFTKSSQSVKYGKTLEHWAPFLEDFPYNPDNFRFLGSPIDGIIFNNNKIIFCEIKTHTSQLNQKQKQIKQQVKDKNIEWLEFRIK